MYRNEATTLFEEDKNAAVDYDFSQQNRPFVVQVKVSEMLLEEGHLVFSKYLKTLLL